MESNFICQLPQRKTIWYKCLVCLRCFQYPKKLILHKKSTKCGHLYPILFPNLFSDDKTTDGNKIFDDDHSSESDTNFYGRQKSSEDNEIEPGNGSSLIFSANTTFCSDFQSDTKYGHLHTSTPLSKNDKKSEKSVIEETEITKVIQVDDEEDIIIEIDIMYKCYFCNLKLNKYTDLLQHMCTHTGENHTMMNSDRLQQPKLRPRSNKTGSLIYQDIQGSLCDFCGETFTDCDALRCHMVIHSE